jgi:hypothetical protein
MEARVLCKVRTVSVYSLDESKKVPTFVGAFAMVCPFDRISLVY